MANPKKVYWDANCWLGYINQELGKADRCSYVLNEARNGNYEIWTSTLTLAEVFKASAETAAVQSGILKYPLPPNKDIEFESFVQQGFVVLVQLDLDIGLRARQLLRIHQGLKKPQDATHLASALLWDVDEMHTFDDKNLIPISGKEKRSDGVALTICYPPEPPIHGLGFGSP